LDPIIPAKFVNRPAANDGAGGLDDSGLAESTLGVLGGMGPAATANFMHELAAQAEAAADQEHPRVIVLSDPSIPDRTEAIIRGDDSPLTPIRTGLLQLSTWGATILAVPCNAAHFFVDRVLGDIPTPLVHIVDATLHHAWLTSPSGAWLAATNGTIEAQLYQRRAAAIGYDVRLPPHQVQQEIQSVVTAVKRNELDPAAKRFNRVVSGLWDLDDRLLIQACTELPLIYERAELPSSRTVSSAKALASACIEQLRAARIGEGMSPSNSAAGTADPCRH
jgi:aspartate racemase